MMSDGHNNKYLKLVEIVEDYFRSGFRRDSDSHLVERNVNLSSIMDQVITCTKCDLHRKRSMAVPGEGANEPLVLVIGEAPGEEEDKTGRPFVGAAGQYLDKWLKAIELDRGSNCFITNVVKCRPPGNRDPESREYEACFPYLTEQIEVLKPKVILTLGRIASQIMLDKKEGIGSLRGKVYSHKGIPLVPTYHPSGVLRQTHFRRLVWEDLKLLQSVLKHE